VKRQIEKKTEPVNEMKTLGVSGLVQHSGYINEEFLPALKGTRAIKVFKEMRDNDPVIGAILFAIDMLLRGVEWTVKPASATPEDEDAALFIEECLKGLDTSLRQTISEVLTMLPFGWAYMEIVYKRRDDGRTAWSGFELRAQDSLLRWEFDEQGKLLGMVQQAPPLYRPTFLPIEKCLLFRPSQHKNNPEGRSVLRNAYRPWYFKKRIEEIEGIGVERDLAGLPVMRVPARIMRSDASAADQAVFTECKNIVRNVRRDEQEGIVLPSEKDESGTPLYDLQLLSTGGTRQFNTNEIAQRYDQRIAMTVLADFILLGHEKVGSFALSSDKTDIFATALGAWLDDIGETLDLAVARLLKLNGVEGKCRFEHGDIETPDLTKLGEFLVKLAGAGMPIFPDDDVENVLRGYAGLPKKVESSNDMPRGSKQPPASPKPAGPAPSQQTEGA
jgi:hypothetical protein